MTQSPRGRRRRSGFTLVELIAVTAFIGILARIGIPLYGGFRLRAEAVARVTDLYTIRDAAYHYYADAQLWPPNTAAGKMPAVLASYLPRAITFTPSAGVTYAWLLRGMPGGDPRRAGRNALMGVGIVAKDPAMRAQLMKALSGAPSYVSGQSIYLLILGPGLQP